MWAVLQGDYSRRIPEAQVPKTTGSSPGPANPRGVGRGKREEERNTKKRVKRKGIKLKNEFKRIQREEKEKQEGQKPKDKKKKQWDKKSWK